MKTSVEVDVDESLRRHLEVTVESHQKTLLQKRFVLLVTNLVGMFDGGTFFGKKVTREKGNLPVMGKVKGTNMSKSKLGGGFNYFLFSPPFEEMIQFD